MPGGRHTVRRITERLVRRPRMPSTPDPPEPELPPGVEGVREVDPVELDAALGDSLMGTLRGVQLPVVVVALIFVALLYSIRPGPWPVAWAVATVGIELLWVVVLRHYSRHVLHASPAERVAFVRRLRPLWRLNGALWGASPLIFAGAPVSMNLLVCWLILGCFGAIVSNAMAPHRPSLMAYLNGFAGAMLASYAIDMWLARDLALVNGALLLLMLLYWFLLAYIGRGQHALLQRAMLLQQRNARLIESLSAHTLALQGALDTRRRFLAVATHDIRQPVHAVRLYADMLSQDPTQVDELAPRIVKASAAVNGLFENLFDLARIDWNRLHAKPQPVRLGDLLADMEVQARPQCADKGLRFRLRTSRALQGATLHTDRLMLQRIVSNLLANAIKYTERGGVLLALRGTPARPRLEVWDTGIGIPPAAQGRVFDDFFKAHTHVGTQDGFGLGLAIVQQLARQLGCSVALRSQEGRGTLLRVTLPAVEAALPLGAGFKEKTAPALDWQARAAI